MSVRTLTVLFTLACISRIAAAANYDIDYAVEVQPERGLALVEITLRGDQLPSKLVLSLDPDRHLELSSSQAPEVKDGKATWHPEPPSATLKYQFVIDHQRASESYDSRVTEDWAILRSDQLIPPIAATAEEGLQSRASLTFDVPRGWSMAAPYRQREDDSYQLRDPGRRFIRPKGWLILGKIASRQDHIGKVRARVAAPRGQDIRLQDTLAFLNWTLPEINKVFPDFPSRLLIISARDPMWRGGLSGTRSLFMHGDRPLISGNRTSSLIHELVHVATGIRGDDESDWIVEGLAEFYAASILHRTQAMSDKRYEETLDELAEWGEEAEGLLTDRSHGAITARAATLMHQVDQEIREATGGTASLDDVARQLADARNPVRFEDFKALAETAAGTELKSLKAINIE